MRVVCPHCKAAYQLDESRVPHRGANVRCSRCHNTFPVRKPPAEAAPAPAPGPVPLPGAGAVAGTGSVPLPPPGSSSPASGGIPLPAPAAAAFPPPPAPSPFESPPSPSPFDAGPASTASSPFEAGPFKPTESPFGSGAAPFDGDLPFEPIPAAPPPGPAAAPSPAVTPLSFGGDLPFEPVPAAPPPPPAAAPRPAVTPLSFGEVDLGVDVEVAPPLPVPASPFDSHERPAPQIDPFERAPHAAPPPAPASSAAPSPRPAPSLEADDLEMLFGESPPARPPALEMPAEGATGYQFRRRSGKIFGPFQEAQIVEMLSKGELLGNEDVSTDGSSYTPIGAVAAFGAALRKAAAIEPAAKPSAPLRFGDRMAPAKVVEGVQRPLPSWARWAALALPVVLILAVGVGAGFTRYGLFFTRVLRRGDPQALANLLGQTRAALARGDFASERAGLDHAARAVAAAPGSSEAAMLHALAVAALELEHGAPPEALAQARKAADVLERQEKGEVFALAARLAMTVCADPVSAILAQEQALESAQAKRKPDPELVALLARSALVRGDAGRAATQATRLSGLEKGPRGQLLLAQAAILRKAPAEAKPILEKLVAAEPELLAAPLELAALDEQSGDLRRAAARLEPLAGDSARARLAPAERARALAILGTITGRDPARAQEADKLLSEAVGADPRLVEARVRLVFFRLRRGDAAGAVAATDPVAQEAAQRPEIAAVRVRALALAGRALDASELAEQALSRAPGRSELVLAKAFASLTAGKPDEARTAYADVLARDPEVVEARVALARFALEAGDLARAGELLEGALVKGARDPAVQAVYGNLLSARHDAAGAEAAYRKALSLDPTHAPAEMGLARLALSRGDVSAARASLASAAAHEPRNADILVEYGTLLWKRGELGPAETAFASALEVAPRYALALTRLGALLLQKGDTDGAVRRLTAASNEAPDLVEARLWLGRALLARGEPPGAIVQLKKAVELSRTAENLLTLGGAYERARSLPEAFETYRAAAEVAPRSYEPQEHIAALLAQNGRCDQALTAFQRAIELEPKLSRLRMGLADCTAKLGKYEEAVKLYQAILRSDPGAVQAYFLLARSLHQSRGLSAALPYYERAAHEEPQNPMPHYYLAYAYKERGQKARAVQEFRSFLERKPDAPEKADIEAEIEDLGGK